MRKRILAILLAVSILIVQFCNFSAYAIEIEKLFEMDLSGFALSVSSGNSNLKSSISGSNTEIEAYTGNINNLVISKQSFPNASGGITEYLNKCVIPQNWYQVGGRLALVDTKNITDSRSYDFWANVTTDSVWKNIASAEFMWTGADSVQGTKRVTLSTDPQSERWIASGGEYFSAPDGWHHVVITRTSPEKVSDGDRYGFEFYVDGIKRANTAYITVPNGANVDYFRLLFGQSRTGGNAQADNHYLPRDASYGGISIYKGILNSTQINSIYSEELPLYTAAKTGLVFTDGNGTEITSLNGIEDATISYTSSEDESVYITSACYNKSNKLISVQNKNVSGSGELDISIPQGTYLVKAFVWSKANCRPVIDSKELTFTDGYDPSAVTINAGFYNGNNDKADYIAGQNGIYAKASLSSFLPPEGLIARISLERDGVSIYEDEKEIVFDGGKAEVTVPYTYADGKDGDKLVFTIYDSEKTYIIKKLDYADASKIVDVILVAGQSNALGQGGDASQSLKPEAGTVFYNSMNTQHGKNIGWDSSLAKTWHEETGHTVLLVKATWGGTGFPTLPNLTTGIPSQWGSSAYGYWNPGNSGSKTSQPYDCYTLAKERYNAAVATIDTDKYTIGDCIYFWNQGENENNSYTAEMYEESFLELHNKFITEFGTSETRLTHGGILPVRSSYSNGFPNLMLTGPRIAQYKMARERDDIAIVSDATEHWTTDDKIEEWFVNKYNGVTYPGSKMPTSWEDIMNTDNVHYKQLAMNEMGIEAAKNMLAYLKENNTANGIDLITPNGIEHYKNGDSIYLSEDGAIPVIPASVGTKASYSISGTAAVLSDEGVLIPQETMQNDYATLVVKTKNGGDMTFRLYSSIVDKETITIAPVKDNMAAIYSLTTDDNYAYTNKWIDKKLEELGMKATMGLITDVMGNSGKLTWAEAKELTDTGRWCIANHTKAHRQADFASLSEEELDVEINDAKDIIIENVPGQKVLAMYTPGGITSSAIRKKVKEEHHILRCAGGGNNSLPVTADSMLNLYSQALFSNTSLNSMNSWVDTGITKGQWIVEMWHGVGNSDAASWGGNVSESDATSHLEYVAEKMNEGKLWVTTLDEAAAYAVERMEAKIHIVSKTEDELVFTLTDELDDTIYDEALTINVKMPSGYTGAKVTQAGKNISAKVMDGFLSITVKPDNGEIKVTFII